MNGTTQLNCAGLLALALSFTASVVPAIAADISSLYHVERILVAGANYVAGEEVNSSGVVAAGAYTSDDVPMAIRFDGALAPLNPISAGGAYANAINDYGMAVGWALDPSGLRQAVSWASGEPTPLGTLGGDRGEARGINNDGVIVGQSRNTSELARAFLVEPGGEMAELPMSLGGTRSSANAISTTGFVAGTGTNLDENTHAVRYELGSATLTDLGTLGGPSSFANGVNDDGHVVGLSDTPDGFRPFLWAPSLGMLDIFSLGNLGSPFGAAYDINRSGIVVGYGEINDNFDSHAFAWTLGQGLVDLNDRIDPASGVVLAGASGINDQGQIVGWGTHNGAAVGFLLTPVPEPSSIVLLGGCFVGLSLRAIRRRSVHRRILLGTLFLSLAAAANSAQAQQSVARQWNEQLLSAIRIDTPRPTVHARNFFHLSTAMYDAWATYDPAAVGYLNHDKLTTGDVAAARDEAISFAAYRLLQNRFAASPGAATSLAAFDARMDSLGYNRDFTSTTGSSPAALGNRIAAKIITYGLADGSNQVGNYSDTTGFVPVNPPLNVSVPGSNIIDPNRWQPLTIPTVNGGAATQTCLTPHWGEVTAFGMIKTPGSVHHDPGPPPFLGTPAAAIYQGEFLEVARLESYLTPDDGVTINISPGVNGNNSLASNAGTGHAINPATGLAYEPNLVKRGDYGRVLAEYWADGPRSETPPAIGTRSSMTYRIILRYKSKSVASAQSSTTSNGTSKVTSPSMAPFTTQRLLPGTLRRRTTRFAQSQPFAICPAWGNPPTRPVRRTIRTAFPWNRDL